MKKMLSFLVVFLLIVPVSLAQEGGSYECYGDVNSDSSVSTTPVDEEGADTDEVNIDLSDVIFLLNYLFLGGPVPECMEAADVNDDGVVDMADAIYLLNHLFLGGPPPPPGRIFNDGISGCFVDGIPNQPAEECGIVKGKNEGGGPGVKKGSFGPSYVYVDGSDKFDMGPSEGNDAWPYDCSGDHDPNNNIVYFCVKNYIDADDPDDGSCGDNILSKMAGAAFHFDETDPSTRVTRSFLEETETHEFVGYFIQADFDMDAEVAASTVCTCDPLHESSLDTDLPDNRFNIYMRSPSKAEFHFVNNRGDTFVVEKPLRPHCQYEQKYRVGSGLKMDAGGWRIDGTSRSCPCYEVWEAIYDPYGPPWPYSESTWYDYELVDEKKQFYQEKQACFSADCNSQAPGCVDVVGDSRDWKLIVQIDEEEILPYIPPSSGPDEEWGLFMVTAQYFDLLLFAGANGGDSNLAQYKSMSFSLMLEKVVAYQGCLTE